VTAIRAPAQSIVKSGVTGQLRRRGMSSAMLIATSSSEAA
jgi:hypothetical protein